MQYLIDVDYDNRNTTISSRIDDKSRFQEICRFSDTPNNNIEPKEIVSITDTPKINNLPPVKTIEKDSRFTTMAQIKRRKLSRKKSITLVREELFLETMNELTKQPSDSIKKEYIVEGIIPKLLKHLALRNKIILNYDKDPILNHAGFYWDGTLHDPDAKNPESLKSVIVTSKLYLDFFLEKYDECGDLSFLTDNDIDDDIKEYYVIGYKMFAGCVSYEIQQDITSLSNSGKIKRVSYGHYSLI